MYHYYYTEYCQGRLPDDSACNHVSTDNTSSCVIATLQCEKKECSAVISGVSRLCGFQNIGAGTVYLNLFNAVIVSVPASFNHNGGTVSM